MRFSVCACVFVCVCDRAVKPPFDNALSAGRPAVASGYRSQLGNAEIETMRREREEDEGDGRTTTAPSRGEDTSVREMRSGLNCSSLS